MRLEVFLSIHWTLGHQKHAFRPTKYSSIKFAKNEIFPKGDGGKKSQKSQKTWIFQNAPTSVFKNPSDLRSPKICI